MLNIFIVALLPKSIEVQGGTVVLNPYDPVVSGSLALGIYEPYESELFLQSLKPGMTVADIGANVGYFSILAGAAVGASGKVFAFEPEPENFKYLQLSIQNSNLLNVLSFPLAVADAGGKKTLNLYDSNKGKHSLIKDKTDARGFSRSVFVEAVDLDSFLQTQTIEKVDLIKMDIEGAESLALKGMRKSLQLCKILFMEFTPTSIKKIGDEPETILSYLEELGFSLFEIDEGRRILKPILDKKVFIDSISTAHAKNILGRK